MSHIVKCDVGIDLKKGDIDVMRAACEDLAERDKDVTFMKDGISSYGGGRLKYDFGIKSKAFPRGIGFKTDAKGLKIEYDPYGHNKGAETLKNMVQKAYVEKAYKRALGQMGFRTQTANFQGHRRLVGTKA